MSQLFTQQRDNGNTDLFDEEDGLDVVRDNDPRLVYISELCVSSSTSVLQVLLPRPKTSTVFLPLPSNGKAKMRLKDNPGPAPNSGIITLRISEPTLVQSTPNGSRKQSQL